MLGLLAAAGLLLARLVPDLLLAVVHCPLREMTGWPCPTCGGTRAAILLASGRPAAAFAANPLVTVAAAAGALAFLAALVASVVPTARRRVLLSPRERKAALVGAALCVIGSWAGLLVVALRGR
ncbi:DUF2752 domain-containing protein [bacterium]|nr:DUF2752 domain-containing protein [bacterium]